MKRLLATILSLLLLPTIASAQVSGSLWKLSSSSLFPVNSSWSVTLPYLGGAGAGCVSVSNAGLLGFTSCGGGAWPFTPATSFGVAVQSTSTPIADTAGLFASSTSQFVNLNLWGNLVLEGKSAGAVSTDSSGQTYVQATSSIANDGSISVTNGSSAYVIGNQPTFGLNLAHSNWWTATQNFTNASTSQFTATSTVYLTNYTSGVLEVDSAGVVYREATTSSSGAGRLVVRDANQNAYAQNFVSAATSFPVTGGTVTLTNASPRTWIFNNGSGSTETMKLPSATTLTTGTIFVANNNASGDVTVVDNGSNVLGTVPTGGSASFMASSTATANGVWDAHASFGHGSVSGTNATGIGTSTPYFMLTVASSTGPQFSLTDTGANTWAMRSVGGNFYLATSTNAATSSKSAFYLDSNGIPSFTSLPTGCVLSTSGTLSVVGTTCNSGTVTSITAGTGLTGGTITTSGTIALNLTRANTWTGLQQFNANASSTEESCYGPCYFGGTATSSFDTLGRLNINTNNSLNSALSVTQTGTNAAPSVAIDAFATGADSNNYAIRATASGATINDAIIVSGGSVDFTAAPLTKTAIASTTLFSSYGPAYFGGSSTTTISNTGAITGASGVVHTFPNASTTNLSITNGALEINGYLTATSTQPATTTSMTLDWASTPPQIEYQIGNAATTVTLINATTSLQWGSRKLVWICNVGGTAGALTWGGVEWVGTAPTQTTTDKQCDVYSFDITRATSTSAYKVAGTAGTGFQ